MQLIACATPTDSLPSSPLPRLAAAEAKAELLAFSRSPFPSSSWPSFAAGAATAAGLPPSFALTPTGAVVSEGQGKGCRAGWSRRSIPSPPWCSLSMLLCRRRCRCRHRRCPPPPTLNVHRADLHPGLPQPAFLPWPARKQVGAGGQSLFEQQLTDRLLQLLSGVEAAAEPLTLEAALAQPPPQLANDDSRLPLTW